MIKKNLHPSQLMTLNDYPVHHEHILKIYHRMFQKGHHTLVPPLPVVAINHGELFLTGRSKKIKTYNALLANFFITHPAVKYCLVDGTHKTTAAALCSKHIRAIVFKTGADILAARKMVEKGELFSLTTGDTNTVAGALAILRKHFFKHMWFETVAEKTHRMVKNKVVPKYMIEVYKKIISHFKLKSEIKKSFLDDRFFW